MKELEFIEIIKNTLTNSSLIGNDCADLKDIGMFISQDSLVEDVHFNLSTTTPYKLGIKAVAVNISDLATTLCTPEYISVGLSLPYNISPDFVRELYRGIDFACQKYNVTVTGGDITRSQKIVISICALGRRRHNIDVSRKFAKDGDFIITTGHYGTSAAGLFSLEMGILSSDTIIDSHLAPEAKLSSAHQVAEFVDKNIAALDTSDGLCDALYKVATDSNVSIKVNFDDIPVLPEVKQLAKDAGINLQDWVLWGGEDYELLFFVPYYTFSLLGSDEFTYIGQVVSNEENSASKVEITCGFDKLIITDKVLSDKSFKHFGG